jgi:hypothetical protein
MLHQTIYVKTAIPLPYRSAFCSTFADITDHIAIHSGEKNTLWYHV